MVYYKRDHVEQSIDTLGWLTNQNFSRINPAYTSVALPQTLQGQVINETRTRKSFNGAIDWAPVEGVTVKLDGLFSEYKIDSKYNAFGAFTNTGIIQSITPGANGTAQQFVLDQSGGMSNDYAMQSNPRDAFNEQIGGHINWQIDPVAAGGLGQRGIPGLEQGIAERLFRRAGNAQYRRKPGLDE